MEEGRAGCGAGSEGSRESTAPLTEPLLEHVLSFAGMRTTLSARAVSRSWRGAAERDSLWPDSAGFQSKVSCAKELQLQRWQLRRDLRVQSQLARIPDLTGMQDSVSRVQCAALALHLTLPLIPPLLTMAPLCAYGWYLLWLVGCRVESQRRLFAVVRKGEWHRVLPPHNVASRQRLHQASSRPFSWSEEAQHIVQQFGCSLLALPCSLQAITALDSARSTHSLDVVALLCSLWLPASIAGYWICRHVIGHLHDYVRALRRGLASGRRDFLPQALDHLWLASGAAFPLFAAVASVLPRGVPRFIFSAVAGVTAPAACTSYRTQHHEGGAAAITWSLLIWWSSAYAFAGAALAAEACRAVVTWRRSAWKRRSPGKGILRSAEKEGGPEGKRALEWDASVDFGASGGWTGCRSRYDTKKLGAQRRRLTQATEKRLAAANEKHIAVLLGSEQGRRD